jgi:hypothetical protein
MKSIKTNPVSEKGPDKGNIVNKNERIKRYRKPKRKSGIDNSEEQAAFGTSN